MQQRCIAKYRATREDLQLRKTELENLISQDMPLDEGEERTYISEQRKRIAALFDQLKKEKERKNELHMRVQAYNEIQTRLDSAPGGDQVQELNKMLGELKTQKVEMQEFIESDINIKLHQRAYEIDFDAY